MEARSILPCFTTSFLSPFLSLSVSFLLTSHLSLHIFRDSGYIFLQIVLITRKCNRKNDSVHEQLPQLQGWGYTNWVRPSPCFQGISFLGHSASPCLSFFFFLVPLAGSIPPFSLFPTPHLPDSLPCPVNLLCYSQERWMNTRNSADPSPQLPGLVSHPGPGGLRKSSRWRTPWVR